MQPELTVSNYPTYFAMKKPFLILFHKERDTELHTTLAELVKDGVLPGLITAWMDV